MRSPTDWSRPPSARQTISKRSKKVSDPSPPAMPVVSLSHSVGAASARRGAGAALTSLILVGPIAAFAGLGFFALYMAGKLHLMDQRGHTVKSWIVLVPLMGATAIALTRTMDYRHHATE